MFRAMSVRRGLLLLVCGMATAWAAPGAPVDLPDPTEPPERYRTAVRRMEVTRRQEFAVSAIKISGEHRRAIVNDRLVAEGDAIGEARVVEILPTAVVVEYLAEHIRVALLPRKIRQQAVSNP